MSSKIISSAVLLLWAGLVPSRSLAQERRSSLPVAREALSPNHAFVVAHDGQSFLSNPALNLWNVPFLGNVYRSFGLSYDGQRFLYLKANGRMPTFSLLQRNLDSGSDEAITPHLVHWAAWAPHSLDIAFLWLDEAGKAHLSIQNALKGDAQEVASGLLDPQLISWSASGGELLYATRRSARNSQSPAELHEYSLDTRRSASPSEGNRKLYRSGSALPDAAARQTSNAALTPVVIWRDTQYVSSFDAGSPVVHRQVDADPSRETTQPGELYALTDEGVVLREFNSKGVEYRFMAHVDAAPSQRFAFTNTWNLPFEGSAYLIQGGALYSNGDCDGRSCLLVSHTGILGYALDWQQTIEEGQGNQHIIAAGDGTVAATYNTVNCNVASRTCATGWDNYSPTCNDPNDGAGNYVMIAHTDGSYSLYTHLKSGSVQVSVNQAITKGTYIADQGHSGGAASYTNYHGCGDHLHFQRQSSFSLIPWTQSIATDFQELPCTLSCTSAYLSQNVESSSPAVTSLSVLLNPSTVPGGSSTLANRILLPAPAPSGGATITLSSSSPGLATVPGNVVVPSGQSISTFPVSTSGVNSNTPVTIVGSDGTNSSPATLTLKPVSVSAVSVPNSVATAGTPYTSEVDLDGPAPAAGVTVSLSSSNPSAANPPTSVSVAGGGTFAFFTIPTMPVSATTNVTISAVAGTATKTMNLRINPLLVSSVSLSPNFLGGGNASSANRVNLSGVAPAGGASITLTSSIPAAASVPASVTVPAGTTFTTFPITTYAVSSTQQVSITATYGGNSYSATLTVNPIVVTSFTLNPATVVGGRPSSYGKVQLNSVAPPGGVTVALTSSDPAAVPPSTVTIAAGSSYFDTVVTSTNAVTVVTTATITASAGGGSASGALTITPLVPSSVNLSQTNVGGGGTLANNSVTLASVAPPGGINVTLTSSNPSVASVPATVNVPASANVSRAFSITTSPVSTSTPVTISATYGGITQTASLNVTPPALNSLTLSPSSIGGGGPTTANTVTLNGPAPVGGASVTLTSSNPAVASVPASAVVPAGGVLSPAFTINTSQVASATSVTITASYGGASQPATLTIQPLVLTALTVSPASVGGGLTTTANSVTLNGPAPTGGMSIALSSSNPAVASVPATVAVPAGSSVSSLFSIVTTAVASATPVTITATLNGASLNTTLTVSPAALSSINLSPASIGGGGPTTANTVTLNGPAPSGGATVTLTSSNPAVAGVPASVVVPAGATVSPAFSISTSVVSSNTPVSISASYGGVNLSATLTVQPILLNSLSLLPNSAGGGNSTTNNRVTLSSIAPSDVIVNLTSSNPAVVSVPSTVTVPAGQTVSNAFTITTSAVTTAANYTVTATYGSSVRGQTISVFPIVVSSITLNPSTVVGGRPASYNKVQLNTTAPPGGASISLTSSSPAAAPPATILIPAGASYQDNISIPTNAITAQTSAVITAAYGNVSASATLTITPLIPASVNLAQASVTGGSVLANNTITLASPAPSGGLNVTLTSANPGVASVPATVNVPAGATVSRAFSITTTVVTGSTPVSISATYGGVTQSATLTVN